MVPGKAEPRLTRLREGRDARGNDGTDIGNRLKRVDIRLQQGIQAAEVFGQVPRRSLADIADTQRKNETGERRLPAGGNGLDQIAGRFLAHALQAGQLLDRQGIEIGRRMDQAGLDQLINQLVAQPLDVHRPPRREVPERLLALRRAVEAAGAAGDCLVLAFHDAGTAFRTTPRQLERRVKRLPSEQVTHWPLFRNTGDDFWDHVARPPDDHRIANPHVLASLSAPRQPPGGTNFP